MIPDALARRLGALSDLGVTATMPPAEAKHVRFANQAALAAAFVSLLFALVEIRLVVLIDASTSHKMKLVAIRFAMSFPFFLPLMLDARGKTEPGRRMLIGWSIVFCLFLSRYFGAGAPAHLFFLPIMGACFAVFPRSRRREMWIGVTLAALGLGVAIWMRWNVVPWMPITRPDKLVNVDVLVTAGALLLTAVVGWSMRSNMQRAEDRIVEEQARAEALLLNILPESIAQRLKASPGSIADGFDEVTVMFADLVGFTPLSASLPPDRLVELMDRIFKEFDELAERHGLEKIKTIGDAYMVAGGIPEPMPGHTAAMAEMALGLLPIIDSIPSPTDAKLDIRVGIARGAAVAGVIGHKKFIYDLWGDAVNTASRLESHGIPGRIQVNEEVFLALRDDYEFTARGEIEIKGKGPMKTWFLVGRRG
ncbi:MAG: adenylate/guanylate cyclase domain-containing protein [Planctomycetota bacterium]